MVTAEVSTLELILKIKIEQASYFCSLTLFVVSPEKLFGPLKNSQLSHSIIIQTELISRAGSIFRGANG